MLSRKKRSRFDRKNLGVQFGTHKVEEYKNGGHMGEELRGEHPDDNKH